MRTGPHVMVRERCVFFDLRSRYMINLQCLLAQSFSQGQRVTHPLMPHPSYDIPRKLAAAAPIAMPTTFPPRRATEATRRAYLLCSRSSQTRGHPRPTAPHPFHSARAGRTRTSTCEAPCTSQHFSLPSPTLVGLISPEINIHSLSVIQRSLRDDHREHRSRRSRKRGICSRSAHTWISQSKAIARRSAAAKSPGLRRLPCKAPPLRRTSEETLSAQRCRSCSLARASAKSLAEEVREMNDASEPPENRPPRPGDDGDLPGDGELFVGDLGRAEAEPSFALRCKYARREAWLRRIATASTAKILDEAQRG